EWLLCRCKGGARRWRGEIDGHARRGGWPGRRRCGTRPMAAQERKQPHGPTVVAAASTGQHRANGASKRRTLTADDEVDDAVVGDADHAVVVEVPAGPADGVSDPDVEVDPAIVGDRDDAVQVGVA